MTRTFTWVNGRPISFSDASGVYHLISDPDGNIIQVKNQAGEIVSETEYTPYGVPTISGADTEDLPGFAASQGFIRSDGLNWPPSSGAYNSSLVRMQSRLKTWPPERSATSAYSILPNRLPGDPTGIGRDLIDIWNCMKDPLSCIPRGVPIPIKPWPNIKPPAGPGCNRYVSGWFPWRFEYVNCCGFNKRCSGDRGRDKPIDCLDRACSQHDGAIPDAWSYIGRWAHAEFCWNLFHCDCSEYPKGSLEHHNCVSAKNKMMALHCAMIGSPPHW